ncbi:MAG: ATP-binding protein [Actinomycetota bacterium]
MAGSEEVTALKLAVQADRAVLSSIRRAVAEWLATTALSPERSSDLLMAVNEATSNVVAHAYPSVPGTVVVEGDVRRDSVVIRVRDTGLWRQGAVGDGGRGYPMMKALVDSVEVSSTDSGTEVLLRQAK